MYWYLILFLIVVFLLSQKEHLVSADPGSSNAPVHDIVGPQSGIPLPGEQAAKANVESTPGLPPKIYDPTGLDGNVISKTPNGMGPDQAPPDTGSYSSDTATQQNAIYFFKPFAMLPFPKADGPPVPYTNDFKPFQK
jgi:hypothetical protein